MEDIEVKKPALMDVPSLQVDMSVQPIIPLHDRDAILLQGVDCSPLDVVQLGRVERFRRLRPRCGGRIARLM